MANDSVYVPVLILKVVGPQTPADCTATIALEIVEKSAPAPPITYVPDIAAPLFDTELSFKGTVSVTALGYDVHALITAGVVAAVADPKLSCTTLGPAPPSVSSTPE
jgi:hypothetical protein